MRKLSFIVLILLTTFVTGCQNDDSKDIEPTDSPITSDKKEEGKKKIYKQNEEAFITDENGEKIYSLTINSVETMDVNEIDDELTIEEGIPKNTKKILILNYTYKYIKENADIDTLHIYPWDIQVYDKNNLAIDFINYQSGTYPFVFELQEINVGRNAQSYGAYSLKNDTTTVQIDFNSDILS